MDHSAIYKLLWLWPLCIFLISRREVLKKGLTFKGVLLGKVGNVDLKHIFFDIYPKCHPGANEEMTRFNLWAECS